jgi:hypothetical protein
MGWWNDTKSVYIEGKDCGKVGYKVSSPKIKAIAPASDHVITCLDHLWTFVEELDLGDQLTLERIE